MGQNIFQSLGKYLNAMGLYTNHHVLKQPNKMEWLKEKIDISLLLGP